MASEEATQRAFSIGDRVRVTDQCRSADCRGAVGIVIPSPSKHQLMQDEEGFSWVEFDTPIPQPNNCFSISSQFKNEDLRPV
jgi:hypothetical protein